MKEIEEALLILRQRKQRQEPNFDFLQKVDDEKAQSIYETKKKRKEINASFLIFRFKSTCIRIRKSIS